MTQVEGAALKLKSGLPHPEYKNCLSVVVPVFNSTESLVLLKDRILNTLDTHQVDCFEIIFVDDCSTDPRTWPALLNLVKPESCIRVLQLTRNFGRTGAVLAGIEAANGEWIVVMDDDLQHRPEDIPNLLAKRSHDVVLAQFSNKEHGGIALLGSWVVTALGHTALGFPPHLQNSAFYLIRTTIAKRMLEIRSPHPFLPALYLEITRDIVGVDAHHDARYAGDTGFTFFKRLKLFANLLINNSAILLRSVALTGIAMAFFSFLYGIYLMFIGPVSVPGWTSLMVVTLLIGGLVLMSLGVTGEYLIRIVRGIEARPAFVVREEHQSGKNQAASPRPGGVNPQGSPVP